MNDGVEEGDDKVTLRVANLSCAATLEKLTNFLTLDATPLIRRCSSVDMRTDVINEETVNYALITVSKVFADDLAKLNGAEFNGREISITVIEQEQSYAAAARPPTDENTVETKVVEIDLRRYHHPYAVRNIQTSTIAQAVMASFPFDDTKQLIPISKDKSLFKLDSRNPDLYENVTSLLHNGTE